MSQATHNSSSNNMAFITMATQSPSSGLPQSSSLLSTIVTSSMATTTPPSSIYPVAPPPDGQDPHAPPASQDGEEVVSNTSSTPQPAKVTLMVRPKPVAVESPSNSEPTPAPDGPAEEDVGASPENGTLSLTTQVSDSGVPRDEDLCDDENPDVNLHEFLVQQLKEPKDRVFLLTLEDELIKYVQDPTRNDQLRLPRYSSYHRMLAHRVAAYFGLIHNVDPFEKTCVIVTKGPLTRIPESRFTDHIPMAEELDLSERKSILRRSREEFGSNSSNSGVACKVEPMSMLPQSMPQATEGRSIEQREREYAEAKARIFNSSRESSLSKEEDSHSADNDGFGSEAGSEEGSQRNETIDSSPSSYRAPTRKKREYRQTQPVQAYIAPPYFRPIPAQYIPGGGAVYWPSHPQMYPSGAFLPQARPGGVGPLFIPPTAGAYPVYMTSQPSPSLSPAHRGQPQPAVLLGPTPGAVGQYFPAQGSPGVLQLGKQQEVNQLATQLAENLSLAPAQDNTQLAMLPDGNYEGVSPSNHQVGVSKPTSESLVTTAQVIHKVQQKGQTPVLTHGHAPSPTHFQMGPYLVGMPYPNPGGAVQFVAGGNQYQQQNVQQHPMMPIPVSTQLPSGEAALPTATVPSPYLYQQVPASPLQQVASTQSFFPGVASMQQQGPPLFSPPGQSAGGGFMSLPSGLFSPPASIVAPRPLDNLAGYPPRPTLAMARTRSGGTVEGGRKGEGKAEDPALQGVGPTVYHSQELPPRFQHQHQHQHQHQQQQQQHRGGVMRYQNQRHPTNRAANRGSVDMQVHPGSSPRLSGVPQVSPQVIPRKEALLPTPPSNAVALPIVPHPSVAVAKPSPRAPPPVEAILEFDCKSQDRSPLTTELRNHRQASRVVCSTVKGNDVQVRAEYARLEMAQSALAHYRERNFKVTLLTPNKSPSRHATAVGTAQQS